jgi:hypothetical protein
LNDLSLGEDNVPKKKKLTLSQVADEVTEIALRHLQQFPEEEAG